MAKKKKSSKVKAKTKNKSKKNKKSKKNNGFISIPDGTAKSASHGLGLAGGFILMSVCAILIANRIIVYFSWIERFPLWFQILVLVSLLVIGALIYIHSWIAETQIREK